MERVVKLSSTDTMVDLSSGLRARKIHTKGPHEGRVEVHRDWHDVFVVLNGSARVLIGKISGNVEVVSDGEFRSDRIDIEEEIELKEGDLIFIPAGTAHKTIVNDSCCYWVFKVPR